MYFNLSKSPIGQIALHLSQFMLRSRSVGSKANTLSVELFSSVDPSLSVGGLRLIGDAFRLRQCAPAPARLHAAVHLACTSNLMRVALVALRTVCVLAKVRYEHNQG